MLRVSNKFYSFIALLFFALTVLGYQLVTTLLLPASSDIEGLSHIVTYPYRAFQFLLAISLIFLTPQKKIGRNKNDIVTVYVIFMVLYFVRIFFDIYVDGVYVRSDFKRRVVLQIMVSVLPSIIATIRCAYYVDYERLHKWLLWMSMMLIVLIFINQNTLLLYDYEVEGRENVNVGMGSLNTGYTCVTLFFVFFTWLLRHRIKPLRQTLLIFLMLMSVIVLIRAGSRGPFVTLFFLLFLFVYSSVKNKVFAIALTVILVLLVVTGFDSIMMVVGKFSPVMRYRMLNTIYGGDSSGRDELYANAWNIFLDNPVLGGQFVTEMGFYSHNMLLDVLMGLGIFGGITLLYLIFQIFRISFSHILFRSPIMIMCIFCMRQIIEGMFSGAMYVDVALHVSILVVLLNASARVNHQEVTILKSPTQTLYLSNKTKE